MSVTRIRFQACPEKSIIWCHRVVDGVNETNYAFYEKDGIVPAFDYLTQKEIRSWNKAIKRMNWSK